MVIYEKTRPYLKRSPTVTDVFDGIRRWDLDNLYPQRALEIMRRSYTLKAVVERVADFLNGEGFEDVNVGNTVVNNSTMTGMTLNKVLKRVTQQYAAFTIIALHIGYDLNYRISSIIPVKPEYLRFGLDGCIKYSTNWERDGRKETDRKIVSYHPFSPDTVKDEIEYCGGIQNYKGQILFLTPEELEYPLATFDPVIDHAQAQAELGIGKVSNVQNSFLSTMAIVFPGEFESDEEKMQFQELIKNKSGARNLGSRIGLQDRSGTKKASDIFQTLSPPNLDRLFEFTEKSIVDAIMENEAMPKEILGVRPDTGMFNKENMEQAYIYFNSITRNRRLEISECFSYLLKYWQTPIITDAKIAEQRYIK